MSARGRGRPRRSQEKDKQVEEEDDLKRSRGRPKKEENFTLRDFIEESEILKGRGRTRKDVFLGKAAQSPVKTEDSAQISEQEAQEVVVLSSTPPDSQKERWRLRSMWELATVLNFLHVFRPVLNISLEFSAEELETALINPNNILSQLHIQLLKSIPPASRTALGNDTWVTALCKKLAVWWPWVAQGEVPLVACHGEEIAAYKALDPGTRMLILKALCEIRLDQDDVWKYIDDCLKHSTPHSTFSKLRMGGDSHGISYWYDGDAIIGHRLYRETQKIDVKLKPKGKGRSAEPVVTCQWETVATSFDEFQSVSEKLTSSRNKLEAGIGKKVKNDILPVLEELQKKKERALKKQQRQAMLLDNFFGAQGEDGGRSRRDRKPVKYTFDDYDRSIDEAIQLTKKSRLVPEPVHKRHMTVENPQGNGTGNNPENALSSESKERSEESDAVRVSGRLTRSNRLRPMDQNYVERKYRDYVSDNDVGNEDGVFMEAVYVAGNKNSQKHQNALSSSDSEEGHNEDEGDEEYKEEDGDEESKEDDGDEEYKEDDGDEEYIEDEEDLEDDDEDLSIDFDDRQARRRHSSRRKTRRKSRYDEDESVSADYDDSDDSLDQRRRSSKRKRGKPAAEVQSGLRRSKRATRVDYRKYEISNSEEETSMEYEEKIKQNGRKSRVESDTSNSVDSNVENESSHNEVLVQARDEKQPKTEEVQSCAAFTEEVQSCAAFTEEAQSSAAFTEEPQSCAAFTEEPVIRSWEQFGEQSLDLKNRHFIDLNEAAPLTGFDDFPNDNMTKQMGPENAIYEQVQNTGNDDQC